MTKEGEDTPACHPEHREGSSAHGKYAPSLHEEDLSLTLKMTKVGEDTRKFSPPMSNPRYSGATIQQSSYIWCFIDPAL
jgi:hypothetical protein